MDSPPPVIDNPEVSRFETMTSGGIAVLEYERSGNRLKLVHTEVPKAARERGTGSRLVEAAFEHARAHGLRIIPYCPFVSAYLERHPELRPLVDVS
jgi:hypothetical protein